MLNGPLSVESLKLTPVAPVEVGESVAVESEVVGFLAVGVETDDGEGAAEGVSIDIRKKKTDRVLK